MYHDLEMLNTGHKVVKVGCVFVSLVLHAWRLST
jgi:hypothetical protein